MRDNICKLYINGLTIDKISKKLLISRRQINKALRQNKTPRRRGKSIAIIPKRIQKKICILFEKGIALEEIRIKCKVSSKIISKVLKENSIKRNRMPGPKNKIYCNEEYFKIIDSAEKAYWLGFIYADGCVRKNKNGSYDFSLGLAVKDSIHVSNFIKHIGSDHKINSYNKNVSQVKITRKKFCFNLMKHGVIQHKTNRIKVPKINKKFIKDFLRGFFDGDGSWSVRKNKNSITFSIVSNSEHFVKDFQKLLCKEVGINQKKIQKVKNANAFRLTYEGNQLCARIYNYLYYPNCFCLQRKKNVICNHFLKLKNINYKFKTPIFVY